MTYTFSYIHKYRIIIAILLAACISASMLAFRPPTMEPAQAAPPPASTQAPISAPLVSYFLTPVNVNSHKSTLTNGVIRATGQIDYPMLVVSKKSATKKTKPVVKKSVVAKPKPKPAPAKAPVAPALVAPAPIPAPVPTPAPVTSPVTPPAASIAGTSPAAAQNFARTYLASKGLGEAEFQCLVTLWNRESSWNFQASNPSSGAYGIPQSLPGSKMASAGADWQTNPHTQIIWGINYIGERYGSPCGAVSIWNNQGWY